MGERPKRPLCQAEGARGSPSGSWVGLGGQLWSSRIVGRRGDATKTLAGTHKCTDIF